MADLQPERFDCPHCQAKYKLVRVDAPIVEIMQEITCRSCGGPLQGREGRFIMKYFLVSKRRRRERV
jgi:hypothetical protein